ncbi:MAG: hypothetical protein P1V97_33900 [Planctomycetota bacterium]|nr:hypothetical protein [Planctomycetota bacterium]
MSVIILTCAVPSLLFAKGFKIRTAKKMLARAISKKDKAEVLTVFKKLGEENTVDAAELIVNVTASQLQMDLSDSATNILIEMKSSKVADYITEDAIKNKKWWIRLLLIIAIDKKGKDERETLYKSCQDEHPVVLEELVSILKYHHDKKSVDAIISIYERADKSGFADVSEGANTALHALTDKSFEAAVDWKNWWNTVKASFALKKLRKKRTLTADEAEAQDELVSEIADLEEERTKDALEKIIEAYEKSEKSDLVEACQRADKALRALTRLKFVSAKLWRGWWEKAKESFKIPKKDEAGKKGKFRANTVTARILKRGEGSYLESIKKGDIIVVEGEYDEVQAILDVLKIPYTSVTRAKLQTVKLNKNQVLIFNCSSGGLTGKNIKTIQAFVSAGGYVFTSDWELHNVLTRAFPKVLSLKKRIDNDLVDIAPYPPAASHAYLRDVFPRNPYKLTKFRWKIDASSDLHGFSAKSGVVPLVFSTEMNAKHGTGVVALTFRWRGGVVVKPKRKKRATTGGAKYSQKAVEKLGGSVLHVLGHFNAQADPKGDGYALQQLLLNFIVEKQKFRAIAKGKK